MGDGDGAIALVINGVAIPQTDLTVLSLRPCIQQVAGQVPESLTISALVGNEAWPIEAAFPDRPAIAWRRLEVMRHLRGVHQ